MKNQENPQFEQEKDNEINSFNTAALKIQFCPYLGLKFDPKSWVGYPSPINCCHRVKPLAVPKFDHQRYFCLTKNYFECPIVYGGPGQKMPKTIQLQADRRSTLKKIIRIEVLVGLLLITVILGAIFWDQINAAIPQIGFSGFDRTQTSTRSPISTSTTSSTMALSSTATMTETIENSPTPSQTPIPSTKTPSSPTQTMAPPVLALETPMGPEMGFIIHAVLPGESLELYARNYKTTVEAIRAINYDLPSFLPLDWIVVIPLNTVDVSSIPPFEPYEVQESVSVEVLADLLSVDLTNLRLYNLIPRGYTLNPGEWLLIPRQP